MQKFSIQFVWCEYCAYLDAIGWNTKERGQIGHQVISKELINCHRRQTETEHFSVKAPSKTPKTKGRKREKYQRKHFKYQRNFSLWFPFSFDVGTSKTEEIQHQRSEQILFCYG